MKGARHILICTVISVALTLLGCATALASSAGNQQYIDPLSNSTTSGPTSPPPPSSQPANSTTPAAPAASSSASPTQAPATTSSATTSSSATTEAPAGQSAGEALPRTGMDTSLTLILGLGLAGAGLALRRTARKV